MLSSHGRGIGPLFALKGEGNSRSFKLQQENLASLLSCDRDLRELHDAYGKSGILLSCEEPLGISLVGSKEERSTRA